ncbi:alkaline phosphatase family protein [Spirochaetia bacterium]|nr:alkaline phosphatase family protein [Spirochaetia bacterium]
MPKLIVFSADALVYEDLEYLRTLPNFKRYLSGGAEIKSVRTIYPSVTYPVHMSITTGNWPDRHGVVSNFIFTPGVLTLPWYFQRPDAHVKCGDIFDAAKKAGLSTAAVFWPVTGNHPSIDYLVDECWTYNPGEKMRDIFKAAGSTEPMLDITEKYAGYDERQHPSQDKFVINCACDIIRQFNPDVVMIHPANVDGYRHQYGLFNEKVARGVEETDQWIGRVMEAAESTGSARDMAFFLISDHGQIDIKRIININVPLADYGLIRYDDQGKLIDWDAYSLSNGMSALVFLKNPDDPLLYKKTHALLRSLCDEGIYGISQVFTEPEIRNKERLGGDFSFVLETDGYTAFGDDWKRPLIKNFDHRDYRYGNATHGYLPDKGPQPVLLAKGKGIRNGVVLEKRNIIDEAPTFAKLLGIPLPEAEGKCIDEILEGKNGE